MAANIQMITKHVKYYGFYLKEVRKLEMLLDKISVLFQREIKGEEVSMKRRNLTVVLIKRNQYLADRLKQRGDEIKTNLLTALQAQTNIIMQIMSQENKFEALRMTSYIVNSYRNADLMEHKSSQTGEASTSDTLEAMES
jgi:hypothetical protein